MYSRNTDNLGTPESAFLMGSNEKSIHIKQEGGKRRNTRRNKIKKNKTQKGGRYLEMVVDDSIPMGPRGGIMSHNIVKTNIQTGGSGVICNDLSKVKTFIQVQQFWQSICPGAVMIYHNYLQKYETLKPVEIKKLVIEYTRAFCHEVSALNSKDVKQVEKYLKKLKNSMKVVKELLGKLDKRSLKSHKMINDRHIETVLLHKKRIIKMKKRTEKVKKIKQSLKNKYNKLMKKTRKMKKHQKGGYNQYLSNVPHSASYESVPSSLNPSLSALANPQYIVGNNPHGLDNYNHFSGSTSETGVFDKAPMN
jgi:hypothetical protein